MVRKPSRDLREYKHIKLANDLQAILITDEESEGQAGCSLTVGVGSLSDPKDLQGLAHFLEHMCFMGTQKYPDERSFGQFISQNGGSTNAYTNWASTTYLFEVDTEVIEEALDRFAQFFIAPLINLDATDREIQAVDSEFGINVQNDDNRRESLLGATLNSPHNLNSFSWGNLQSLANRSNLHDEALKFHGQYYSSNIMTLCVLAPSTDMESLET